MRHTLAELNALDREAFGAALGWVCEHSPWVAARAWERRPFASLEDLHAALVAAIREAAREEQLALLRAHPELGAARAAPAGVCPPTGRAEDLTAASAREQAGAGLTGLDAGRAARLAELNRRYRERFGFPFILAVRGLSPDAILDALERRLERDPDEEFAEAMHQVGRIVRFRLEEAVAPERGPGGDA